MSCAPALTPCPPGGSAGLWTFNAGAIHPNDVTWQVVIGDTVPLSSELLRVRDGSVVFDGDLGTTPVSGAGTRFMYIPDTLGSMRTGFVTGTQWDPANIGLISYAFGQDIECSGTGAAAFGATNDISGIASFAAGTRHVVSADVSIALGEGNVVSTVNGVSCAIGFENVVDGGVCHAFGEDINITSDAGNAQGMGEKLDVTALWALGRGQQCIAQRIGGETLAQSQFSALGDNQTTRICMRRATTDATPTELTLDGAAPSGAAVNLANRLLLEDQHSYVLEAYILGRDSGGAERAAYKVEAVANRGAGAASVTVDAVTTTTLFETTGTMDATATADVVNGSVQLLVTGVAATNMRWVAHLNLTEVRFD